MSAFPGRYQSRLLSFLSQQVRRFGEKHDRAVRHLKVTTAWSAQILLYPIYALLQTARLAGKQLQPYAEREKPQLQNYTTYPETATADTPIARILETVKAISPDEILVKQNFPPVGEAIPSEIETLHATSLLHAPVKISETKLTQPPRETIRGVATLLETKTPVLVSDRNEIIDILTPQQHRQLCGRIIEEVADYWHYCRNKAQRSPFDTIANFLPPIRLFFTAMVWMQTTPLAVAIDLFQEAAIVYPPTEEESTEKISQSPTPPSPINSQGLLYRVQKQDVSLVSEPMTPETLQADKLGFQVLIRAAIDFFFGISGDTLPAPRESRNQLSLNQIAVRRLGEQPSLTLPDPWLTSRDLFGSDTPAKEFETRDRPPMLGLTLPASPHAEVTLGNSGRNLVKQSLKPADAIAPKSEQIAQTQNSQSISITQDNQKVKQKNYPATATQKAPDRDGQTQSPAAPEWIETKAYSVGYVKHPLEALLEWVDRALLWFEKIAIEVWRWVLQTIRALQ